MGEGIVEVLGSTEVCVVVERVCVYMCTYNNNLQTDRIANGESWGMREKQLSETIHKI